MAEGPSRWRRVLRAVFGKPGGNAASVALLCALVYLYFFSGIRFFLVPSESMEPTLLKGDYLITTVDRPYRRGDIVVLADPEHPGDFIVKRIIAVGGDVVWISAGIVCVNGEYLDEPYAKEPPKYEMWPVRIPYGGVFVLGDNRNHSHDSHAWKQHWTSASAITGKVRFIYSPISRMGRVRSHEPKIGS